MCCNENLGTVSGLQLVVQMPAGALFYESVPGDVREFVMRLLHHALPFATDTAQDAEVPFNLQINQSMPIQSSQHVFWSHAAGGSVA